MVCMIYGVEKQFSNCLEIPKLKGTIILVITGCSDIIYSKTRRNLIADLHLETRKMYTLNDHQEDRKSVV